MIVRHGEHHWDMNSTKTVPEETISNYSEVDLGMITNSEYDETTLLNKTNIIY